MDAVVTSEVLVGVRVNELMEEFRTFVSSIQTPDFKDENWEETVHQYCAELSENISEIHEMMGEKRAELSDKLEEASDYLRAYSLELQETSNAKKLQEIHANLSVNYEELVHHLQKIKLAGLERITRSNHLKPTNYLRSVFHMCMGLSAVLFYQYLFTYSQVVLIMSILTATAVTMEVTRRFYPKWNDFLFEKVFGVLARPFEKHTINGMSFYVTALLISVTLFPQIAVQLGVLILGFSDPAASLIGKKWGRKKLYKDKSLEGTLTFFVVATISTFIFMSIYASSMSFGYTLSVAITLGVVGAVTELFSSVIDDNFSIPVACSFAAFLIL